MKLLNYQSYIKKFNKLLILRDLTSSTIKSYNSMLHRYLSWLEISSKMPEDVSFEKLRFIYNFSRKNKSFPIVLLMHTFHSFVFSIYIF